MKYFVFILFIFSFLANTFELSYHEELASNSTDNIETYIETEVFHDSHNSQNEHTEHSNNHYNCTCHRSNLNIITSITQKPLKKRILFEREIIYSPIIQKLSDFSSQDIKPPIS